jgi:hypothetical protein
MDSPEGIRVKLISLLVKFFFFPFIKQLVGQVPAQKWSLHLVFKQRSINPKN